MKQVHALAIQATWDEVDFENASFNRDRIEKCLAHEDGRSSRSIYNKAEYDEQRRHTLQEWANTVDAWIDGQSYVPKLIPENVVVPTLSATA